MQKGAVTHPFSVPIDTGVVPYGTALSVIAVV
jgi:hypothetical protein